MQTQADGELVALARTGDPRAFTELCSRHRSRVWKIVCTVSRGPDAEDLAQEVVIRAYRSLGQYGGKAPFGAWLCRIAVNIAHDHLRSAWKRRVQLFDRVPDPPDGPVVSPALEAERRDTQERVRRAVASLPAPQRVPIWLHFFEGYSLSEVARLEGAPDPTIRSRLRAGLKRLERELRDLPGPFGTGAGAGEGRLAPVAAWERGSSECRA